jgi:chromosome segregation ATPase
MRRLHSHEWEHLIKTKDDEIARLLEELERIKSQAHVKIEQLRVDYERLNAHCADLSRQHHEALDGNERLRKQLSGRLQELHEIRNQSLSWAMACPCECAECTRLYDVILGEEPK